MTSTRSSLIWLLGLGAFGLAFSITTTAAYLPPLLAEFTDSQTVIAAVLAAEGLFALTVPLVIGPWSDTFLTPMGRRRPFMLVAIFPMGFCLALVAFMPNIWTTAFLVMAFFAAYYVYEPPYRGLYPDLLHESVFARSQGVQHILRVACGAVVRWVREDGGEHRVYKGIRAYLRMSRDIFLHSPDVRLFLFAMACWEGTFAAMRTFVVLYVTQGLDQSRIERRRKGGEDGGACGQMPGGRDEGPGLERGQELVEELPQRHGLILCLAVGGCQLRGPRVRLWR